MTVGGRTADVSQYLRAVRDLSPVPVVTLSETASEIPLRLQLTDFRPWDADDGCGLTESGALDRQRMLVVMGGPGTGKSWLACRYARLAAEAALKKLEDGAAASSVEIPVVMTWEAWAQASGDAPRERVVNAASASGATCGGADVGRFREQLADPAQPLLIVVDALDEAADPQARSHLGLLESLILNDCRVILTSRPEAWQATANDDLGRRLRVVEIQPLAYPGDVHPFVHAWFATDTSDDHNPGREQHAATLIERLDASPDLQQNATVPLLLTIYCLLTGTSPTEPIPTRTRDLYARVLDLLMAGPDDDQAAATTANASPTLAVLTQWAGRIATQEVAWDGRGLWPSTFPVPASRIEEVARGLDAIAPQTSRETGDGHHDLRGFIHRTFLDHLVAEYVSGLPTDEAAELLLPHLWWDTDWTCTVPASVVAHHCTHPAEEGRLLRTLLERAQVQPDNRPSLNGPLDRLLLRVASRTDPADWPADLADQIHACRVRCAATHPTLITCSIHWTHSNPPALHAISTGLPRSWGPGPRDLVRAQVTLALIVPSRAEARDELLTALPDVPLALAHRVVDALLALDPTGPERDEAGMSLRLAMPDADLPQAGELPRVLVDLALGRGARDAVRGRIAVALPEADPRVAVQWVPTLVDLAPTEPERAETRHHLVAALPSGPTLARALVETLVSLDPTDRERAEAYDHLIAALTAPEPDTVRDLARAAATLQPNDADRLRARRLLTSALREADPGLTPCLLQALTELAATSSERAETRQQITAALGAADRDASQKMLTAMAELATTDSERAETRQQIVARLRTADPGYALVLIRVLVTLDPTGPERAQARQLISPLLLVRSAVAWWLVRLLPDLARTDTERAETRRLLTAAMAADPAQTGRLMRVLMSLGPTDPGRAQARRQVASVPAAAHPSETADLVRTLLTLNPTDAERAKARDAVTTALPDADPYVAQDLLKALFALGPTESERAQVRHHITTVLAEAGYDHMHELMRAFVVASPTHPERAEARTYLTGALPQASSSLLPIMVRALAALSPTGPERAEARDGSLTALAARSNGRVDDLVWALVALSPTDPERDETRHRTPAHWSMTGPQIRALSRGPQWEDWIRACQAHRPGNAPAWK